MINERIEVFIRVFILIFSGIILAVWRWLIIIFIIINLIYTLFKGKRHKEIAELSEIWNTQFYIYQRYIILQSNKRPFPFGMLEKSINNFEEK